MIEKKLKRLSVYQKLARKGILYLGMLYSLIGCWGVNPFGVIDESYYKPTKEKPTEDDLVGLWKLNRFCYSFIKEQNVYPVDSITLSIRSNGTFKIINLPDLVADDFGHPINGKLMDATGTWEVDSTNSNAPTEWGLQLMFDKRDLQKAGIRKPGLNIEYQIYQVNKSPVLFYFIGDPDNGKTLVFEKR
ncbi:hypothetical protein [Spirosoma pomorum]